MVFPARLVVDYGDEAGGAGTENVLGGSIGNSAFGLWCNIGCRVVRPTLYLIECSGIGTVQGTRRAVCCYTWRVASGIDVARRRRNEWTCSNEAENECFGARVA